MVRTGCWQLGYGRYDPNLTWQQKRDPSIKIHPAYTSEAQHRAQSLKHISAFIFRFLFFAYRHCVSPSTMWLISYLWNGEYPPGFASWDRFRMCIRFCLSGWNRKPHPCPWGRLKPGKSDRRWQTNRMCLCPLIGMFRKSSCLLCIQNCCSRRIAGLPEWRN